MTKITVDLILKKLSEGMEIKDLLHAYPQLKEEDIKKLLESRIRLNESLRITTKRDCTSLKKGDRETETSKGLEKELFEQGYEWASNYDWFEGYQEENQDFWLECNDSVYDVAERYVSITGKDILEAIEIAQEGFDTFIREFNENLETE